MIGPSNWVCISQQGVFQINMDMACYDGFGPHIAEAMLHLRCPQNFPAYHSVSITGGNSHFTPCELFIEMMKTSAVKYMTNIYLFWYRHATKNTRACIIFIIYNGESKYLLDNVMHLKGYWTTSASSSNLFQKSWDIYTIRSVYICSDCMLKITRNFNLITKICEFFLQRPFKKKTKKQKNYF